MPGPIPIVGAMTARMLKKLKKFKSGKDTTIKDFVEGKNLKDTSRYTFKDKMIDEEKKLNDFIRRSTMTETMGKGNKK
tara:strand:+ start:463 stop:696 length:234 start_codon:yes stop_codon:yes gene_type:complete